MRTLPCLLFLPLFALTAHAQMQPPSMQPAATQTSSAPAATQAAVPPQSDSETAHHTRLSWEKRFEEANVSHDGHLTIDQAKADYKAVARHFHEIDTEGKGYVTVDDIRAWHKQQRDARHGATGQSEADDSLRPRPAMHRLLPGQHSYDAPIPSGLPPQPDAAPTPAAEANRQAAGGMH